MRQRFSTHRTGFGDRDASAVTPYEAACQIKYSTWPLAGTTVVNEGLAGATYNGTSAANTYTLLKTGASAFTFNGSTDKVTTPKGTAINNLTPVTFEWIIYRNIAGNSMLWSKQTPMMLYEYVLDANGTFDMARVSTEGAYTQWKSAAGVIPNTAWSFIQWAWSYGTGPDDEGTPILKVNNVPRTMTKSGTTHALWDSDASYDAELGHRFLADMSFTGTIALQRIHNAILNDSQLTRNYYADRWRVPQ